MEDHDGKVDVGDNDVDDNEDMADEDDKYDEDDEYDGDNVFDDDNDDTGLEDEDNGNAFESKC